MKLLRDGDTLVVTRLDRLGRSVVHLVVLGADLRDRGIVLRKHYKTSLPHACHVTLWCNWSWNGITNPSRFVSPQVTRLTMCPNGLSCVILPT